MPHYKNFRAVVYCTAQSMVRISPEGLQRQIDFFQKYVGVDKVYLEPYRDDCLIPREQLHMCKELFRKNGIEVAGGITTTISGQGEAGRRAPAPVQHLLLLQRADAQSPEGDRRVHRQLVRRVHHRRLLLHQLHLRRLPPRKGRPLLGGVPPGPDEGGLGEPPSSARRAPSTRRSASPSSSRTGWRATGGRLQPRRAEGPL